MNNIFGHQLQKNILSYHLKNDLVFPAYLFFGPSMIGKKTLALEFAKNAGASGVPDLMIFDLNPFLENPFNIKTFKEAKNKIYLKPLNSKYKFIIFDNFEYCSDIIQNALLKIIEEPPPKTIFIFISQWGFIQKTLLSRLFKIKFYPLNNEEMKNYIQSQNANLDDKFLEKLILFSAGKPGLANWFLKDQIFFQNQNIFLTHLDKVLQSTLLKKSNFFSKYFSKFDDKDKTALYFDILLAFIRNLILSDLKNAQHFAEQAQFILKAKSFIIKDRGLSQKLIIDALAFKTLN